MGKTITTTSSLNIFKRALPLYNNTIESTGTSLPEGTELVLKEKTHFKIEGVWTETFFIRVDGKGRFVLAADVDLD